MEAQEIKPLRPVEFETGSDVIRPASYSLLDEVVKASSEHGVSKLLVGGHTDDVGSDSDNMRLSQRRRLGEALSRKPKDRRGAVGDWLW